MSGGLAVRLRNHRCALAGRVGGRERQNGDHGVPQADGFRLRHHLRNHLRGGPIRLRNAWFRRCAVVRLRSVGTCSRHLQHHPIQRFVCLPLGTAPVRARTARRDSNGHSIRTARRVETLRQPRALRCRRIAPEPVSAPHRSRHIPYTTAALTEPTSSERPTASVSAPIRRAIPPRGSPAGLSAGGRPRRPVTGVLTLRSVPWDASGHRVRRRDGYCTGKVILRTASGHSVSTRAVGLDSGPAAGLTARLAPSGP